MQVTLDTSRLKRVDSQADFAQLDEAISELAKVDERKATLIELKYFGELTFEEITHVTGLSPSTIVRDLRIARAWLKDYLSCS